MSLIDKDDVRTQEGSIPWKAISKQIAGMPLNITNMREGPTITSEPCPKPWEDSTEKVKSSLNTSMNCSMVASPAWENKEYDV